MKVAWQTFITDNALTDVEGTATIGGQPRHLRWLGDNAYQWIQNVSGQTLNAGDCVCFSTNDLTGARVYRPAATAAEPVQFFAGVVSSDTIPNNQFGWIQRNGYNSRVSVNNTAVAGGSVVPGSGTVVGSVVTAAGTAPTQANHLIAAEAWSLSVASLRKCFVNCLNGL